MKRQPRIIGKIGIAVITLLMVTGCTDGVRQTIAPYFFTGLQTIAAGLIAGLEEQVYPDGSTSSTAQDVSDS